VKTQLSRKFDMLRRVQQYLDDAGAKLAGVNATAARKELDGIVTAMAVNEAEEGNSALNAKGQVAKLRVLRADLWNHHMRPVATIAAAHLRDVPEFSALRMPQHRVKSATLVQHAIVMADAARERQEVFVKNGLVENFADELTAAAAAVRATIDSRGKSISVKASARSGLKVTGARAPVVLRLLDAQVKKLLVDDPKALAGWNSVKRIGRGKVTPIGVTTPSASGQGADAKAA
jgi:hypothetical protein